MRWPDGIDLGIDLGQARCIKRDARQSLEFLNQLLPSILQIVYAVTILCGALYSHVIVTAASKDGGKYKEIIR